MTDTDFPRVEINVKCAGDEAQLIAYLEQEVIPKLKGGVTRGYAAWYEGWVANLIGNHSEERNSA